MFTNLSEIIFHLLDDLLLPDNRYQNQINDQSSKNQGKYFINQILKWERKLKEMNTVVQYILDQWKNTSDKSFQNEG